MNGWTGLLTAFHSLLPSTEEIVRLNPSLPSWAQRSKAKLEGGAIFKTARFREALSKKEQFLFLCLGSLGLGCVGFLYPSSKYNDGEGGCLRGVSEYGMGLERSGRGI